MTEDQVQPIQVPIAALPEEVLDQVIASFVLQEGTDYGEVEYSLAEKVAQIKQ